MNISALVRPNIRRLNPFSSARAEFEGKAEVYLDANENPFPTNWNRYPDPFHCALRDEIAKWRVVHPENIILGNGSDELIDIIIRTFCEPSKDIIRCIRPTFGMYQVSAAINDVEIQFVDLGPNFELNVESCLDDQKGRNKVLILCSPNNPTGNDLDYNKLIKVIRNWQGVVVLDEAYIDFSDQESLIRQLSTLSNLIILQTFSKALAGAGLRIGMGFASKEIIAVLNKVKPPYNIGSGEQRIGLGIVRNRKKIEQNLEEIKIERLKLEQEMKHIAGIKMVFPSHSNFFLVRFEDHIQLKITLQEQGIIVRDRSSLRGCENCLRITVGLTNENKKLINAIKEFYN